MIDTPVLAARDLHFGYRPEEMILRGVDLSLSAGEIKAVIGPNGSGKTTLLSLLAWTLKPSRGEVRLFGEPMANYSPRERARKLALVPQEPTVAFPFTAMEVVLMGRSPYLGRWELEGKDDLAAARRAMAMTAVSALADRRFQELSGGERQRVMVAKALAQDSRVLLLDEPTAFLDLKHQVEIYALVRQLSREEGIAALAVSHDMNLAAMFCDRMAVLNEGQIAAEGPPAEIMDPELLGRVYQVEVAQARHPLRGEVPLVFPISREKDFHRN